MGLIRRQAVLALARLEWKAVVRHLESNGETARAVAPALAILKQQLEQGPAEVEALVAVSQPTLAWSPVLMALALSVLRQPDLLPLSERLRDQLVSQSVHVESCLTAEGMSSGMRRLPLLPDDLARRITSTN